jgi:hypothetical protein
MTTQPSYAGEFFDLSITSINNDYGALHNIGVMLYGINFPLEKFIKELQMILNDEGGGATDDKAQKRQKRLVFLQHCDSLPELQTFFERFCNYLNGKDGSEKQYSNFIVITAAGGNIIIVFAQLIMNIIDSYNKRDKDSLLQSNKILLKILLDIFKKTYDDKDENTNLNNIVKSIVEHFTTNPTNPTNPYILEVLKEIADSPASDCDFKLSPNIFQTPDQEAEVAVDKATSRMTDLDMDDSPQDGGGPVDDYIQELNAKITQVISELDTSAESEKKKASFTLIIDLLLHVSQLRVSDEKKASFTSIIDILLKVIYDNDTSNAGFLLFRAKTLIDCRQNYNPPYTPKKLKEFKETCLPKYQKLYPQIIQQNDLDEALAELSNQYPDKDPKTHPCFLYLNHLMEKKKAIKDSTQHTIDQIIELFAVGYFKQANSAGHMAPLIRPSIYKTEALIAYIKIITFNINTYISKWFTVDMTPNAAPAKSLLGALAYDYKSLVELFLSLDSINNSLIPLLSADILNYFINDPSFHTETILDELIKKFNANRALSAGQAAREALERARVAKDAAAIWAATRKVALASDCVMLPSDILLVPTRYQKNLLQIKNVFNNTLNVGLGYPDGLRITINAIITEKIKDITVITDKLMLNEQAQQYEEYKDSKSEEYKDSKSKSAGPTKTIARVRTIDITDPTKKLKEPLLKPRYRQSSQSSQSSQSQSSQSQSSQGGKKYYKKNITFKKKIVKKTNEKLKTKSKKTRRQKNLRKVTLKHKKPRKHKSIKHKYRKHKL